jgi:hypothetical protein
VPILQWVQLNGGVRQPGLLARLGGGWEVRITNPTGLLKAKKREGNNIIVKTVFFGIDDATENKGKYVNLQNGNTVTIWQRELIWK